MVDKISWQSALKETILCGLNTNDEDQLAEDRWKKNADYYAELVKVLDDKSLLLIRYEGDDGRKAQKIL